MTDYAKSTNFAVKDTLTSGDPNKVVSGAEIDTEFNNVASSSTTKIDKVPSATTGNLPQFTATGAIEDSSESTASLILAAAPPSGVITVFAGTSAPTGWLECDGSNVSRSTYADLFSAIGTNFGVGDGTTTFGLPDLRGEFVRGWDNGRGVDSGRSFGSNQSGDIQSHNHSFSFALGGNGESELRNRPSSSDDRGSPFTYSDSTNSTGGSETRPRNVAMMYIIKT